MLCAGGQACECTPAYDEGEVPSRPRCFSSLRSLLTTASLSFSPKGPRHRLCSSREHLDSCAVRTSAPTPRALPLHFSRRRLLHARCPFAAKQSTKRQTAECVCRHPHVLPPPSTSIPSRDRRATPGRVYADTPAYTGTKPLPSLALASDSPSPHPAPTHTPTNTPTHPHTYIHPSLLSLSLSLAVPLRVRNSTAASPRR